MRACRAAGRLRWRAPERASRQIGAGGRARRGGNRDQHGDVEPNRYVCANFDAAATDGDASTNGDATATDGNTGTSHGDAAATDGDAASAHGDPTATDGDATPTDRGTSSASQWSNRPNAAARAVGSASVDGHDR